MFVEGKSRTVFFPSDTLIYGISRDGSKKYNIRTCEHMILGQPRMGARQRNYAPLWATHIIRNIVGNVGNTTMLCHTVTFVLTGNPAFGEPYKRWKKRLQLGIWPN